MNRQIFRRRGPLPRPRPERRAVRTLLAVVLASAFPSGESVIIQPLPPTIDPYYAGSYTAVSLGVVPLPNYNFSQPGGLVFRDLNSFYIIGANSEIDLVTVVRGADQHITGFAGLGVRVASASDMNGGLQIGPGNILFFSNSLDNQLGQFKSDSGSPDKIINLTPLGFAGNISGLAFVPSGIGGAGTLKLASSSAMSWYSTSIAPDGQGTFHLGSIASSTELPEGSWRGMVYVHQGQALFPSDSVLLNADWLNSVYAFEVDSSGNPIAATQRHFMDFLTPSGIAIDPLTGDLLVSSESGGQIALVRGFAPVLPPPAPELATSKSTYQPGEPIVVNFSNAPGNRHDWIGLYPAGTANQAYLQWTFTDGTPNGTVGRMAGAVTFPAGLPSSGSYEARLLPNDGFVSVASVAFTVQGTTALTTSKAIYSPGEPIVVNFYNAPGNPSDWIGLFGAGAANQAYLQWAFTDGTKVGTPGLLNGSVTFPAGFASAGSYQARLLPNDGYVSVAGASFGVQGSVPGAAANPSPALHATGVSLSPTLSWTAGAGATSHDVYFGTNPTPGASEWKGRQNGTSYLPEALAAQTTYYWRIDEINGQGTTPGSVWAFTTTAASVSVTTSKTTYNPGESIVVHFSNAPGNKLDWIGLFGAGTANQAYLWWMFTDGSQVGTAGRINGTVTFTAGLVSPGSYEVRLLPNDGYVAVATGAFTVQSGPAPSLTTTSATYARSQAITVNFFNAPGNARDWIGLYAVGAVNTAYLQWIYTDETTTGTGGLVNGRVIFGNGLSSPGGYEARLFSNNTYTLLTSTTFQVQ